MEKNFEDPWQTVSKASIANQQGQGAKVRTGLKNQEKLIKVLVPQLPKGMQLGEAYDQGDCFFDALAQLLNSINNTDLNSVKYLRTLCHEFYLHNKALVDQWNASEYGGLEGRDDYYFVQYTAEECEQHFKGRAPIWGRPNVEGKILCHQLQLDVMFVIEILEDPETQKPVLSFHRVDKNNYKSIPEEEAKSWLNSSKIPTIVVEQNSLHFVPLTNQDKVAYANVESVNILTQPYSYQHLDYIKQYREKYTEVLKALEDLLNVFITKQTSLYQANTTFLQNLKTELIILKTDIDALKENNFAQLLFVQQSWQHLQESVQDQLNELEATLSSPDKKEQPAKKYLTEVLSNLKQAFDFNVVATEFYVATAQQLIYEAIVSTHQEIGKLISSQPKCFISYAWGITEHEQLATKVAAHLQLLGIEVWLDRWSNSAGAYIDYFTTKIGEANYVILLGSKKLVAKYKEGKALYDEVRAKRQQLDFSQSDLANRNYIVNLELHQIFTKGLELSGCVIPLLLDGNLKECLPPNLQNVVPIHLTEHRDFKIYSECLFELVKVLLPHATVKTLVTTQQQVLAQRLALLAEHIQTETWQRSLIEYAANKQQHQSQHQTAITKTIRAITDAGGLGSNIYQLLPSVDNFLGDMNNRHQSQANNRRGYSNTNEVITQVTALLRQRYQTPAYAELKRLLHERTFPITESFINLAIVKEQEQKPKEQQLKKNEQLKGIELLSRDELLNSFETIYQAKAPIKLQDLLFAQRDERQVAKRQLIEGRAGIGKTTLCQYLAHQWAAGKKEWDAWRQQFDWVIHLSLRQLTTEEQFDFSKLSLADWLYTQYLTPVAQQQVTTVELGDALQALNAQGRVLLLLDGYDEIVPILKTNRSFNQFFEQELLSCSYWFIFSRPYYVTDNRVERRLENIGFTQEDIPRYVQQYFRDVEKETLISQQVYTNSLMAHLNQNPNAMGIAHIPINLELLCYAWESGDSQLNNQLTLTQLYDHLVLNLFGRYLHKYYPKDISLPSGITWKDIQEDKEYYSQQMLTFLEQLAWLQMQQPGLIISADLIKKIVSNFYPGLKYKSQREAFGEMVLKQLGLLKGCDIHKPTLEQSYYFIHLTFQEYFAARHWVQLFQGEEKTQAKAIQLLRNNKLNPRYEIVWWIAAGLLKEHTAYLTAFFELLTQAPKDLAKLNQQLLQLRCLEESQLKIGESKKTKLLTELGQWLNYEIDKRENYNINFIATYLGMGLQVLQEAPVKQVLDACLKKHKLDRLVILAKKLIFPLEIIMQLVTLLSDPNWWVSSTATEALGNQSSLPESVCVQLVALLSDPDMSVIFAAAQALGKQSSLPKSLYVQLVALLSNPDEIARSAAAEALGKQSSLPESACVQLVTLLSNSDEYVRHVVVDALGKQSSLPQRVYVQLVALLSNSDRQVSSAAAHVLGKQSSLPQHVCVQLVALLSNSDRQVSSAAAHALGKQSSLPQRVYVQLAALLSDPKWNVRYATAHALGKQSSLPQRVCVQLVALLSDSKKYIRSAAVKALGKQSSLPESVCVQLAALLSDPDETVRAAASQALGNQSSLPESVYVQLVALLSDSKKYIRSAAVKALGNQSSLPESVYVQLVTLLSDPDKYVRYVAAHAQALGNQSSLPESVYVQLVALLSSPDKIVRFVATKALGKQISLPQRVCAQVAALLSDPDKTVRSAASQALDKQSSLPESEYVQLVALLSNPDKIVRSTTAQALSQQSSLPESVNVQLGALLSDPDWSVKEAAAQALGSQQFLSFKILNKLGLTAITHGRLVGQAIRKLSIECLIETIKEYLLSANFIPLLRLLLIKSHQQKLPIYFVDNEQSIEQLPFRSQASELHIGHLWQGTFTDQQKQLFIKTFNYVFFEMIGMLPELSSAELQDFKNLQTGQMLSQATTLIQFKDNPFPMNFMADKRIMSRILFFTPAGQVLDSSQQEKIITYAENRKTLHRPLDKFSFWQCIGICNNQNSSNVFNTHCIEEVENPQHPKELEIRK